MLFDLRPRLPIFPGEAASGCSVQDEISEAAGWRRAGVPASSVDGQDSCGGAAGECSADSGPAESGESAVMPDPKSAGWIRRYALVLAMFESKFLGRVYRQLAHALLLDYRPK